MPDEDSSTVGRRRLLAYFLAGMGGAFVGRRGGCAEATPALRVWAADRAANRLYGLDADLIVRLAIELLAPTRVLSGPNGGVWVASAREARSDGAVRLASLSVEGEWLGAVGFRSLLDLAPLDAHEVLALEGPADDGARPCWCVGRAGDTRLVDAREGTRCVAGSARAVLLGSEDGLLTLLAREGGRTLARSSLGDRIESLASDDRGGWWVLARRADRVRLARFDSELRLRTDPPVELPGECERVFAGPDECWVCGVRTKALWRVDGNALQRVDRGRGSEAPRTLADFRAGERSPLRSDSWGKGLGAPSAAGGFAEAHRTSAAAVRVQLGLLGLGRGFSVGRGEALAVAAGALVHLDSRGQVLASQGGFALLCDAAPVRSREPPG